MALLVAMATLSAVSNSRAVAPRARVVAPEYLSQVLKEWRGAKKQGGIDTLTRLEFANRALAVAEIASGRERYEALRFAAGLDTGGDSAELQAARELALARTITLYIDDGDMMGEFVLRVLRDDAHDQSLRAKVRSSTRSDSVRAACEFFPVDGLLDRALDDGEITTQERDLAVAVLQGIATNYGAAKYPLSAKTWGEFAELGVASLRELVLVGERAPELVGLDVTGAEVRLSALRGKAVLLCFWGDWCLPCRSHYARQRQLVSHLAGKPFALIGVNSDPDRAVLEIVSVKQDMRWPNVWDGAEGTGGMIATRWGVRGWPTWYLLDAQGIVRTRWRGVPAQTEIDAALETWIPKAR